MNEGKRFLVRTFDTPGKCEEWLNEQWPDYEPVSMSDTRNFTTVLVRLAGPNPLEIVQAAPK